MTGNLPRSLRAMPLAAMLVLTGGAAGATTLPLEPGLYLPANVRCGNASAETEVFNIDSRGVSTSRMTCTVAPQAGRPNSFEATCREGDEADIATTNAPVIKRVIRVLSPRTMTLDGENYRFCQALDD
ncbi:hypothetical protein BN1110_02171 [bacterium YEK0313]|nr:hypothetical protein BN1110_02171 [bacterium YEK0313]